jgi:hypothetical protein
VKPLALLPLLLLLLGSAAYRDPLAPAAYSRDPILQGPEAAALKTGAPEATVAGIRFAESSGRPAPAHRLPSVLGAYGLDSRYHTEREAKYGSFDELDPYGAAYVTARLYLDNLGRLGDEDKAIAAHFQGARGVRRDGVCVQYVAMVRAGR